MFVFALSPLSAQAGFFSSLMGEEVSAQQAEKVSTPSGNQNSQTMALLEVGGSRSAVFQDKNAKSKDIKKEDKAGETIDTSATVSIVSDSVMLPSAGPMKASSGGIGSGDVDFEDISVYVVRSGDTVTQVAEMFDVSVDTILSVNDLKKGEKLKEGEVLLILPFSGVEHTVVKGQTLQGIANIYKVDMDEILLANDIDVDSKLVIGEKLMIPGAGILSEIKPKSGTGLVVKSGGSSSSVKYVAGYFQNPVPSARKSRGVTSSHKGVDLAAPIGTPIYASAAGRVLTARMGWNGAYGNMVILQHSNGTRTIYGHMSRLGTSTGAQVSQGQVIGYVGNTGRSTGPHLHFEVLGGKNPF
ncbi:MAG: LysM peptidoglycan-binding domain-containing M23 family metallopeptidase [Patescibacteria group bacterium]